MTAAAYREQRCTCAEGLELYCRVFCPDLRGRGLSARDPQWRNYHPTVYLADLQRVLQALEVERVAIVGTSLGGLLGMMLGAAVPQRVAGLVLNDIHGALSDILRAGTVEREQREKPDLGRVTVGNRGHVPLLDESEALTATDGFLACLGS
jgi:pimeloyl-ACP methyl ester carboxylesterase